MSSYATRSHLSSSSAYGSNIYQEPLNNTFNLTSVAANLIFILQTQNPYAPNSFQNFRMFAIPSSMARGFIK